MASPSIALDRPSPRALHSSQDLASPAPTAFDLLCEVEKWPVWLSFVRSARRLGAEPLGPGSEIALRSEFLGPDEEVFEVDRYVPGHHLSLVGAYSIRRRIDLRLESKTERSKLVVRVDYPTYGGAVGKLVDRFTRRRKLEQLLDASLVHFKGLCEFDQSQAILDDF